MPKASVLYLSLIGIALSTLGGNASEPGEVKPRASITAPGWAWGRFHYPEDFDRNGEDHLVYDLIVEQGLRFTLRDHPLQPELFARLDLKRDNQFLDYDNRAKPALGARLWLDAAKGLRTYAGVYYEHEHRWQSGARAGGLTFSAGWQGWWRLHEEREKGLGGVTLSTWGEVKTPYSHLDDEKGNAVVDGGAEVDTGLYRFSENAFLLHRAGLEYSLDSEKRTYRNWLKPSLGLVLQYRPDTDTRLELGARTAAEWRFRSGETESGFYVFAIFARNWNIPVKADW